MSATCPKPDLPIVALLASGSNGSIPVQVPPALFTSRLGIECFPKPISRRSFPDSECKLASWAAVTHLRMGLPNGTEHLTSSAMNFGHSLHEITRIPSLSFQYRSFHSRAHLSLLSRDVYIRLEIEFLKECMD